MFDNGFKIIKFPLPHEISQLVKAEDWEAIDKIFLELNSPNGEIFEFMNKLHPIKKIEQMISIRDANNPWEEDGIWHDDGSRNIAYSLSLTMNPSEISGGKLGLRKIGSTKFEEIPTPRFGEAVVFLTGNWGYEHKIHQVISGRRIILVGWCT